MKAKQPILVIEDGIWKSISDNQWVKHHITIKVIEEGVLYIIWVNDEHLLKI